MMHVIDVRTQKLVAVAVKRVENEDFKIITKKRFFFNWKSLRETFEVFKLILVDNEEEILGVVAVAAYPTEQRLEIKLLASALENVGNEKKYEKVAHCLIAFVGREAIKRYSDFPCISLTPKTRLKLHYMRTYGFMDGGRQLFLEGDNLMHFVKRYYNEEQ